MSESSAGEAHGHHVWPVVAAIGATLGTHERSSTEFSHGDDEGLVEEASFFEIGDEGGEEMVEEWEQWLEPTADASVGRNVISVSIPGTARSMVAEVEGDEGDTGFDEASSEEGLLAPEVRAVALSVGVGFEGKVKGFFGGVAEEEVHGLLLEAVDSERRFGGAPVMVGVIEGLAKEVSILDAVPIEADGGLEHGGLVAFSGVLTDEIIDG